VLIRFNDGRSLHGLIVGLTGDTMRVVIPGREDIFEFNLVNGQWVSPDTCELVAFEFPLGLAQHEYFKAALLEAVRPVESFPGYLDSNEWVPQKLN